MLLSVVHHILTAIILRNEPGGIQLSQDHPVASCVLNMLVAKSGTILSSMLLGEPIANCIHDEIGVWLGVLSWYLVYFCPKDIFYYICTETPVKFLLLVLEEIRRATNVMSGVTMGFQMYPNSFLPAAVAGMLKGTGKKWSIRIYRFVTASSDTGNFELFALSLGWVWLHKTITTKCCFLLAAMYTLNLKYGLEKNKITITVIVSALLVTIKLKNIWQKTNSDPLLQVQAWVWSVFTNWSFPNNTPKMDSDITDNKQKAQ